MEVLANAKVIILLQYISVLNQHIVLMHFKHCMLYVNFISIKLEKENT